MLNKPKFMSPSINMYGNSVIDLNSATLPFSCIVDGNEAITDFQIVVSKLSDNTVVFDTGMQTLDKPFFPINNRNQNVLFSINLKDYYATVLVDGEYISASVTLTKDTSHDDDKDYYVYDSTKNAYKEYDYDSATWDSDRYSLYELTSDFVNSTDAYYWAITLKNSNSGTETYSAAEVFYANDIPRVEIQYNSSREEDNFKKFSNNLVYNGDTLKYSIGWTAEGCSFENTNDGHLRLVSKVNNTDNSQRDCVCYRNLDGAENGANAVVYCSAQVRGFKTNSANSIPTCFISDYLLDAPVYFEKIRESENINDGGWHTLSVQCEAGYRDGHLYKFNEVAMEIKNARVGDVADFKDVCVFNLTEIYGSGNEPSKEWCDNNLDSLRAAEIISMRCKFKANYTQAQDIPIKKYGWRITDATSGFVIMDTITQNQIYGIADDISCVCNGLMNKTKYILELYVETQNGYFDILQSMAFYVGYPVKNIEADFDIVALNDTAGIMLNWGDLKTTEGVVVGDAVSYIEHFPVQSHASINIPKDTSVVFAGNSTGKDLEIDENSYVVLSFQIEKGNDMPLFEMSGEDDTSNLTTRKLETVVEEGVTMLQYIVTKGNIVASRKYPLTTEIGELSWHVVVLYPLINNEVDFKLIKSTAVGGLFPCDDLYPVDLYTYDANGDVIEGEYNKASEHYDPILTYFKLIDGELIGYVYNEGTWSSDWKNLYCCLHPYFGEWDELRN